MTRTRGKIRRRVPLFVLVHLLNFLEGDLVQPGEPQAVAPSPTTRLVELQRHQSGCAVSPSGRTLASPSRFPPLSLWDAGKAAESGNVNGGSRRGRHVKRGAKAKSKVHPLC